MKLKIFLLVFVSMVTVCFVSAGTPTGISVSNPKLVSLWQLDEVSGNVIDSTGYANGVYDVLGDNTTVYRTPTPTGYGINWTSTDSNVNGARYVLDKDFRNYTGTNDFTITSFMSINGLFTPSTSGVWSNNINSGDAGIHFHLLYTISEGLYYYRIGVVSGNSLMLSSSASFGNCSPIYPSYDGLVSNWTFFSVVVNSSETTLYVNGDKWCSYNSGIVLSSNPMALYSAMIGDGYISDTPVGSPYALIDEVAFFYPSLTSSEIKSISDGYFGLGEELPSEESPVIEVVSPLSSVIALNVSDTQLFNITVTDGNEEDVLSYVWSVNNSIVAVIEDYSYVASVQGSYNISIVAYDNSVSNLSDSYSWIVNVFSVEEEPIVEEEEGYMPYNGTYSSSDLPNIFVDGIGTAGSAFVQNIDLIVIFLAVSLVAVIAVGIAGKFGMKK